MTIEHVGWILLALFIEHTFFNLYYFVERKKNARDLEEAKKNDERWRSILTSLDKALALSAQSWHQLNETLKKEQEKKDATVSN